MKNLQLLTIFSILFFFGCSSNNDEPVPDEEFVGSYEASITGDLTKNLKGESFFLHAIMTSKSDEENGSTLGITLVDDTNEDNIIVITVIEPGNLSGIETGTYTIDMEPEDGETYANVAMYSDGSLTTFLATSGQVKLTKIEGNRVEGTVTATLTNFKTEIIEISGTYKADGITEKL